MQDKRSQEVTKRFFRAIDQLKSDKRVRGRQTVCSKLGINRRNLWQLEQNMESDILKLRWLTDLVVEYGISAEWLLTGAGSIYTIYKKGSSVSEAPVGESQNER